MNKPESKATTVNPKDLYGEKKVSFTKIPATALLQCALAMMNGASKYGPYNWRDKEVIATIYIDAALRHIYAWYEGEEIAVDSGVHHLGHAMACLGILLDAMQQKKMVDDRPFLNPGEFAKLLQEANDAISKRKAPPVKVGDDGWGDCGKPVEHDGCSNGPSSGGMEPYVKVLSDLEYREILRDKYRCDGSYESISDATGCSDPVAAVCWE